MASAVLWLREGRPSGSRAQDFDGGRIYSHPTIGAFSVPSVFVDAIDKRGGEEATGLPIAEPTSSPGIMQTWLFQRFTRPDHPDLVPSTLEIRSTPPRLWIERQPSTLPVPTTGTVYEDFPCAGNLGPCMVDEPMTPPHRGCGKPLLPRPQLSVWHARMGAMTISARRSSAWRAASSCRRGQHPHPYINTMRAAIVDCPSD
jgi:hypothetical protein